MANRGRPAGQMTTRRRQVLEQMTEAALSGERLTLARLARRCALYDYREARRIVADLRKLGHQSLVDETNAGRLAVSATITPNRIRTANRRAAWFGAHDRLSVEEVAALMNAQGEVCALCPADLNQGFNIDHKLSLRLGGDNTITNIQLLCPPCNIAKG